MAKQRTAQAVLLNSSPDRPSVFVGPAASLTEELQHVGPLFRRHPRTPAERFVRRSVLATATRRESPEGRIIICADDDYRTAGNPGLLAATKQLATQARCLRYQMSKSAVRTGRPTLTIWGATLVKKRSPALSRMHERQPRQMFDQLYRTRRPTKPHDSRRR